MVYVIQLYSSYPVSLYLFDGYALLINDGLPLDSFHIMRGGSKVHMVLSPSP